MYIYIYTHTTALPAIGMIGAHETCEHTIRICVVIIVRSPLAERGVPLKHKHSL